MKEILLTRGYKALVDDEDYDYLNQWKWHTLKSKNRIYAIRQQRMKGKKYGLLMHRILCVTTSQVDHINGNGLDNRKENLRPATSSQNMGNSRSTRSNSGYKGVSFHKETNKFRAYIMINGKFKHLGLFDNKIKAAEVYNLYALKYFGEFALLNTISNENQNLY